ncbi:hypothetical protein DPM19_30065 [Actinomadura craniellae]|uniref:Uncharacterized protein n=1 Tax=Actinomadura craniellae TaxID=2231787 RepID=A0A365GXJ3_9ACTN|nr:DUF6247 family protein [Actinomadura craniellae]RAY11549.1 hypothetical protein DPM19_30065 [Actinomadura craniellae]
MSAQPIHGEPNPRTPLAILAVLPEREHETFLRRYREVTHAVADDVTKYPRLEKFLNDWSLRAHVVSRPGYDEELEATRWAIADGTMGTVSGPEAIAAELARRGRT